MKNNKICLLAFLAFSAFVTCAAVHLASSGPDEEQWQHNYKQEPWNMDIKRFVTDMLVRWREDYSRLSEGEMRLKIRDVILGVEQPGQRYTIETQEKGSIVFENIGGVIHCNINRPGE